MQAAPFLVRFGATVGVVTLAALLAAAPGAVRLSSAGEVDWVRAWLTLAGLLILPMLVMVPIARFARDGLHALFPTREGQGLERVAGVLVFACTWLWLLSAFGAALRDQTHQRSLGAVTFAVFAIVTLAFLALVAKRLVTILRAVRARRRDVGNAVAALAIGLPFLLLALRVARAAPDLTLGGRATLIDGFAITLAVAFAARKSFEPPPSGGEPPQKSSILTRVGPPAAVCLVIVSMHTLVTSLPALHALEHACPLYLLLLRGFALG